MIFFNWNFSSILSTKNRIFYSRLWCYVSICRLSTAICMFTFCVTYQILRHWICIQSGGCGHAIYTFRFFWTFFFIQMFFLLYGYLLFFSFVHTPVHDVCGVWCVCAFFVFYWYLILSKCHIGTNTFIHEIRSHTLSTLIYDMYIWSCTQNVDWDALNV